MVTSWNLNSEVEAGTEALYREPSKAQKIVGYDTETSKSARGYKMNEASAIALATLTMRSRGFQWWEHPFINNTKQLGGRAAKRLSIVRHFNICWMLCECLEFLKQKADLEKLNTLEGFGTLPSCLALRLSEIRNARMFSL